MKMNGDIPRPPAVLTIWSWFDILPELWMALIFMSAVLAPHLRWSPDMAECRLIMLLEGGSILCISLVGVYMSIAFIVFPAIAITILMWMITQGSAGFTWSTLSFGVYLSIAFVNGLKAHKGFYGPARGNPAHPHRRYDRMFLLYLLTGLISLFSGLAGFGRTWPLWGAGYFSLVMMADNLLQPILDPLLQGTLRRLKSQNSAEVEALLGLCFSCLHVQPAVPPRRRRPIRCGRAATDDNFEEFPVTPVKECSGYRKT